MTHLRICIQAIDVFSPCRRFFASKKEAFGGGQVIVLWLVLSPVQFSFISTGYFRELSDSCSIFDCELNCDHATNLVEW
jgi:hypothetical protein